MPSIWNWAWREEQEISLKEREGWEAVGLFTACKLCANGFKRNVVVLDKDDGGNKVNEVQSSKGR